MKIKFSILVVMLIAISVYGFFRIRASRSNISLHKESDVFLRVNRIRDIKIKKIHIKTPKHIRAVYMSSWIAGNKKLRSQLVDFIKASRINAVVLDIKDYSGRISFPVDEGLIAQYQTSSNRISDIRSFIEELHENNIYLIGRVTVFQDPLLAKVKPDFAFKRRDNGGVWKDRTGLAFINPQKKEAWNYYLELAKYSYQIGFDEINFDYIRYPSDGNLSNINYELNGKTKLEVMKSFYKFLDKNLRGEDIPISADLFGFTSSRKSMPNIGQSMVDALPYFDAVAPMIYPSHYPRSYLGFSNPAAHPYEVVYHEMDLAKKKVEALQLPTSSLRTWIQDFNMGARYGVKEIQDQIKASYDAGVTSYMVWDPNNRYSKQAYYKDFLKNYE